MNTITMPVDEPQIPIELFEKFSHGLFNNGDLRTDCIRFITYTKKKDVRIYL